MLAIENTRIAGREGKSAPKSIAVIGAGYAGCAAAVELADQGHQVVLFEASRSLGGRARAVPSAECLDNGQHILVGAYAETLGLMRRVGADPDRLLLSLPLTLCFPGHLELRAPRLPAPLHMAVALLGARGLSWREKLAAVRLMQVLKRHRFRLEQDDTVAELLRRLKQPARLIHLLWEPLCVAALNTPAGAASAQVFANVLRDTLAGGRSASDLLLPRCDLSTLFPKPATDYLRTRGGELRLSTAVRSLEPLEDGRWQLAGQGWREDFDAVVLAVAPHHAEALLPRRPELAEARARLAGLEYEPIVTCYLRYGEAVSLPRPMIGLDGGYAQWVFDRRALLGQGETVFAAVISASGRHRELPADALAAAIHAEIQSVAGPLPPPLWHRVITEKRATFACRPNLRRPGMESGLPGLLLCGDYVASDYPATLESAVRSGLACARAL